MDLIEAREVVDEHTDHYICAILSEQQHDKTQPGEEEYTSQAQVETQHQEGRGEGGRSSLDNRT